MLRAGYCGVASAADGAAQPYVPSPVHIGWEVWVGAIAGVIPFAIGSYQFIARIVSMCRACCTANLVIYDDSVAYATQTAAGTPYMILHALHMAFA